MYNVSDNYKIAVADSHRKSKMRAILTIGTSVINLDDNDIIKDSVYITNQCTNGENYEYGCVYAGECGITIKSEADRYSLYDAKLELFWSLLVGTEWEEIPLGVFYITEPNRINDKISIKALDGMSKLDIDVTEDTQGTMVQLINYIAEKCGITLAQTDEELSAFINSNVQYSVYSDKVKTYRDLLAYVCMMSASFATFDRFGKLKIVPYATESSLTFTKKQRFTNASFSDYKTSFSGVKARFIAEENYAPYEVKEEGNGLILDMGDNPIVRGLPETKHELLNNVFSVLKNVSYTPFELETLGNPAIDIGDMITNTNVGRDSKTYKNVITYYYWTYRGKHKLKGVGGNPRLSGVKNKSDKQTSSLEGEIEAKSVIVKSYTNADEITFSGTEKEIAAINFATTESCKPILLLTVRLETSIDGVVVLQFYEDGLIDEERVYRQYVERGSHIITLAEIYASEANERHTITITAKMEYFESDTRKQDADITTYKNFLSAIETSAPTVSDNVVQFPVYNKGVIDTTVATATIGKGGVKAILYGQGISAGGKWDGTISILEDVEVIPFTGITFAELNDTVGSTLMIPTPIAFNETLSNLTFGSISFADIQDSITIIQNIVDYTFSTKYADIYTFDRYVTAENGMFALNTTYTYESEEQTIDTGKMCSVAVGLSGLTVESVVVENG